VVFTNAAIDGTGHGGAGQAPGPDAVEHYHHVSGKEELLELRGGPPWTPSSPYSTRSRPGQQAADTTATPG